MHNNQSPLSRADHNLSRRRGLAQAYRSFNFESILDKSYQAKQKKVESKIWQG